MKPVAKGRADALVMMKCGMLRAVRHGAVARDTMPRGVLSAVRHGADALVMMQRGMLCAELRGAGAMCRDAMRLHAVKHDECCNEAACTEAAGALMCCPDSYGGHTHPCSTPCFVLVVDSVAPGSSSV